MTQFRVLLEGGEVLVVTLAVEAAPQRATIDPRGFGEKLLEALGMGDPSPDRSIPSVLSSGAPGRPRNAKPVPPPEPDADAWLAETSRESLRHMK